MSQPPDDYHNASTENNNYPPRQWSGYPQQGSPSEYPPQQGFPPNQGPVSQPGFPQPQGFPPNQGPGSQPGFPQQGFPPNQRPGSQPGFPQQGFPPNQGPVSQPGFPQQGFPPQSPGYPQQSPFPNYSGQLGARPGNFAPPQGPASYSGQLQQNFPPPQWQEQQNFPPPQWQEQPYGLPPSSPNQGSPRGPKKARSGLGLFPIIMIVLVVLIVLGGAGAFLFLGQKGNARSSSSTTQNTPATGKITPTTTQSASGTTPGTGGSGQTVQAGSIWVATITKAATTTSSQFPPNAGDTYLEISMTLKNVSTTAQPVSSLIQFSLVGTNGAKYTETLTDTNIHQTPDGTVNAGKTLSAQVAYQVPKSQHTFVLTFAYGLINGSNASVSWRISA